MGYTVLVGKIINWLNSASYRKRLSITYLGLTSSIVVFAIIFIFSFLTNFIASMESRHFKQLINVVNSDLASKIKAINSTGFNIVLDSTIRDNLNQTNGIEISRAKARIDDALKSRLISNDFLSAVTIIDTSNHIYSQCYSIWLPEGFDFRNTEVFRKAAEKHGAPVWLSRNDIFEMYLLPTYDYTSDINVAAVIMDYSHQTLLGLAIFTINRAYFSTITYPEELFDGVRMYLVNPDKTAAYNLAGRSLDLSEEELRKISFQDTMIIDGKLVICKYNNEMEWYLVCMAEVGTLREATTRIAGVLILVLVLCVSLAIAFSLKLAKHESRGIEDLLFGMKQIEEENFNVHVPVIRDDDIGTITKAFNHMVGMIKDLIYNEYQEKLLTKEAQFKSLQAQVNPHFLMNTFDMLHWRLIENGQDVLAETVVSLGNLMRYSMDSHHALVPLKYEIKNIQEYVDIHVIIRGFSIDLNIDVDPVAGVLLPRQSLQPLVENSLRHGFAKRKEGNRLEIIGRHNIQTSRYELVVRDNGVGIPEARLRELQMGLSFRDKSRTNVGLQNVASRIWYMDPNAVFDINSEHGVGTEVTIEISLNVSGSPV